MLSQILVNVTEEAAQGDTAEVSVKETVNSDPATKSVEQSGNNKTTLEEVNGNATEPEAE